jgi:hypothetical protein
MKLELKHLAPYLPYGLKAIDSDGNIDIVTCIDIEEIDGYEIKPILRPLSDLDKEITHNGESFVPLNKIFRSYYSDYGFDFCAINNFEAWALDEDGHPTDETMTLNDYLLFFEWHFDVFGLIDNGLAIDINTLKS